MTLTGALEEDHALVVDERFEGGEPDPGVWIPYHLPQWSCRDAAAARYETVEDRFRLKVDGTQPPWCPEFDGATRVSSLQTGVLSGPVGSSVGQHRFNPEAVVRESQPTSLLHTPERGALVLRARARLDAESMAALWMIGVEDEPERSGVVDVMEVFGRDIDRDGVLVGMGVHPFADPHLSEDHEQVRLPIDVAESHEYAIKWTERSLAFFVDGDQVREVHQSPGYPMQVMLGVYSFVDPRGREGAFEPALEIESFRSYRPTR